MIESYLFRHKGGEEKQKDDIFVKVGASICIEIVNGTDEADSVASYFDIENLNSTFTDSISFKDMRKSFEAVLNSKTPYMLIKLTDSSIELFNKSNSRAYIVKDGEIKTIPNGLNGIEAGDRIICGTDNFFKYLTTEAVLIDALSAISAEEWIDFLITRISQKTKLSEGNLAAASFFVRGEEKISVVHLNRRTS